MLRLIILKTVDGNIDIRSGVIGNKLANEVIVDCSSGVIRGD
mgnify:FL=1|tara:strand:+ start:241735 stop:241860 length:126 start_codon:yes stop_codon:yes gene_type:complete